MSRLRLAALFALTSSLLTTASSSRAQDAPQLRQAAFVFDEKQMLRASLAYHDVVDGPTVAKLKGGLPTIIVMSALLRRDDGTPLLVAPYAKSCRVIFDLWDEVYRLEISQAGNPTLVTATPTVEGVLRRCAEVDRLAIVARSLLSSPGTYHLEGVVEINPVSTDMRERIKRWVSRPSGASTAAPGDALFGSFVGLFVARIGSADRQITFRTQSISL